MSQFIHEAEVYRLLNQAGIATPKHRLVQTPTQLSTLPFAKDESLVVKGLGEHLWHKSDVGALVFCAHESDSLLQAFQQVKQAVEPKHDWIGALVSERVDFVQRAGLPSELFVSLKMDECCGAIISFGLGGVLTEDWARALKDPLLIWPASVYSADEALAELKSHWLGQLLLGQLRQQKPLVSEQALRKLIHGLWRLERMVAENLIELLEINPMVIRNNGEFCALDGVGLYRSNPKPEDCPVSLNPQSLLTPKNIAIAGVSDKSGNVSKLILDNLRHSRLPLSALSVIKPGVPHFEALRAFESVKELKNSPVDILILALPAPATVESIVQLLEQQGGAEVVYIVAGGIGDGADSEGFAQRLEAMLHEYRQNNKWTPLIIGPNGLCMLNAPLKLNTLFIPQKKLNVQFSDDSKVALVSQSGAFLITRLSRHSNLKLKYGFSIGNQMDMKLSDFMRLMLEDQSVRVLALYVEGFKSGDICHIAKLTQAFRKQNRHVIIYKGGRSAIGQAAAAGHTGAMTGDYAIQRRLLKKAGAIVVESFNQFNTVFKWLTAYPELKSLGRLAIVANAGYETVGSVDILGDNDSQHLLQLSREQLQSMDKALAEHGLRGLVAANNPLDLTPMADEAAYLTAVDQFIAAGAGVIMVGMVPLSERLDTEQLERTHQFIHALKERIKIHDCLIGIIIDAGLPYQNYKAIFERHGFPVFDGIDMAALGINVLRNSG